MKSKIFLVEFEEADGAWHVFVPELEHLGAATWGKTREEAMQNIQEVMQMVVEEMLEEGNLTPT